jgi:20S proteasome alpha/beta subunit
MTPRQKRYYKNMSKDKLTNLVLKALRKRIKQKQQQASHE